MHILLGFLSIGDDWQAGKWRVGQESLFLYDSVGFTELKSKEEGQKIEGQEFVIIKFIDENGTPFTNLEVGINEDSFYKKIDHQGIVKFEFSELKKRKRNQPKNTVEVIEFKTERSKRTLVVPDIFNNQIIIVEDYKPKKVSKLQER